jgi:hypothetical protein
MNYTLHKLQEGFIVTSDEDIQIGEKYIDDINSIRSSITGEGEYWRARNNYKKVIAQHDQIDFSILSEEEQKEIGWFDVEKLAYSFTDEERKNESDGVKLSFAFSGFIVGFQKAQELLSDRRFTLEDMREAIVESWNSCEDNENDETFTQVFNRIIQSLSQPKSWKVEGILENDKFKITKIL